MIPGERRLGLNGFSVLCAVLLLLGYSGIAGAQTAGTRPSGPAMFSVAGNHPHEALLDGPWRFHFGDNPAWANPDFDDSHWALMRPETPWSLKGFVHGSGYGWYRFDVYEPDGRRPLALLLGRCISGGCTVYANGKRIGQTGTPQASRAPIAFAQGAVLPVPAGGVGPRTIHFAIRRWAYGPIASWAGATLDGTEIGDPALMAQRLRQEQAVFAREFVGQYSSALLALLAGLTILALFLFHREDREYLWFSIVLLGLAASWGLHLVLNLGTIRFVVWNFLSLSALAASGVAALLFFSTVLRVRRRLWWWMACVAMAASPLTVAMIYFEWTGVGISFATFSLLMLPEELWVIGALAVRSWKKDVSAWLLLVPSALYYGGRVLSVAHRIAWQVTGNPKFMGESSVWVRWPFPLGVDDLTPLVFIFALLVFLVWRFARARHQEARLSAEMEAARSVQGLLVPAEGQSTPEFGVESVYRPAREVSGDFFQILPRPEDGSVLIVAGDVAGKGLSAGMLVAVLVGAIRSVAETTREPLALLAALNRRMLGRGDAKATCLAVRLERDGSAVLANAGHLPPYVNGRALKMEGALPLGVMDGSEFSEMRFALGAGETLVMISDGIVEAMDERGNLFGFERVEELLRTAKSAAEIAEAAQKFGQEDDISVIAVMRR